MQSQSSVVLVSNQSPPLISALRHEPIRQYHGVEEAAARRRSPHPASALLGCVAAVDVIIVAVNVLLSRCLEVGISMLMAPAKVGGLAILTGRTGRTRCKHGNTISAVIWQIRR